MKKNKILAIDFGENNVGLAVTDPGANLVFGKGISAISLFEIFLTRNIDVVTASPSRFNWHDLE